jgi:hypothetical protein
MKTIIVTLIGAGVLMSLAAPPLYAAEPAPPADVSQLIDLFDKFCIAKFPDDAAVKELAKTRGDVALTPAQVMGFLHNDPGYGWMVKAGSVSHFITIELPPYQTCAIRRMTPTGAGSLTGYIDAIKRYAAANNRTPVNAPDQKMLGPNGEDVTISPYILKDASGKPTDQFAIFSTNYHGRPPPGTEADAAGGFGVEIRMVHQLVRH